MVNKKKIREEFNKIFTSGKEKRIKEMLEKFPWLLDEVSNKMEGAIGEQQQIIAALGVMEDELGGPVPLDEIVFSLRIDFDIRKGEAEVLGILKSSKDLQLVKKDSNGWTLTVEGGKVCDDYLNKNFGKIEI
jgi:Tfp pilus assembly protein PilP